MARIDVLPRCEATNLGVFDPCHFALLKRACANSVWVWSWLTSVVGNKSNTVSGSTVSNTELSEFF